MGLAQTRRKMGKATGILDASRADADLTDFLRNLPNAVLSTPYESSDMQTSLTGNSYIRSFVNIITAQVSESNANEPFRTE